MLDLDTFLVELYVMVDDFCKTHLATESRPGREAALSRSEVVTLGVVGQWARFQGERDFYRFARRRLRRDFPTLPTREQFNRHLRHHTDAIIAFGHFVAAQLERRSPYEALDGMGVATRHIKRRGSGWLAGQANVGYCNRLGVYEGVHILTSVTQHGVITGYGIAPASAKDQPLAETFLAARHGAHAGLPEVGQPTSATYVTDNGFCGEDLHRHWRTDYGAHVISPPQRSAKHGWPKAWRRWLARVRQIVETVHDKLLNTFRLSRERPHDLYGLRARLAAKVALHNFCISLNHKYRRPWLAFADLIDW